LPINLSGDPNLARRNVFIKARCASSSTGMRANMPSPAKPERYRVWAEECEKKAQKARDCEVRWQFREMARQWRNMARQREQLAAERWFVR
jgi:hypothetical protein